jgi:Ca2+-transporting ATPase
MITFPELAPAQSSCRHTPTQIFHPPNRHILLIPALIPLRVMSTCSILVDTLNDLGEVVGVTGDGTNDSPVIKYANVGFSTGIAGTEIAKEASDIILMDDNFSSIVSPIMWGRCVNDSMRKFLQFQISVNITAVLVPFISSVASSEEESVLTVVQLLRINTIMDTFATLALATDPATLELLKRRPDCKNALLFAIDMGQMIIGQSIYQTFIVLLFHLGGNKFWEYHAA